MAFLGSWFVRGSLLTWTSCHRPGGCWPNRLRVCVTKYLVPSGLIDKCCGVFVVTMMTLRPYLHNISRGLSPWWRLSEIELVREFQKDTSPFSVELDGRNSTKVALASTASLFSHLFFFFASTYLLMTMMFETVHICSDDGTIVLDCSVTSSSLTMGVSLFKGLQKRIWRKHKPAYEVTARLARLSYLNDTIQNSASRRRTRDWNQSLSLLLHACYIHVISVKWSYTFSTLTLDTSYLLNLWLSSDRIARHQVKSVSCRRHYFGL